MPGMIGAGQGYERNALQGMERMSEQEQQRQQANNQIEKQQQAQAMQMGAQLGILAYIALA